MSDNGKPSLSSNSAAEDESLPALVAQLGENLITLLDTKLSLLKIEIKEDISAYVRNGIFLAIGALILIIGFALLNIAIACLFSSLFENTQLSQPIRYALGFLLTSLIYLISGALVIVKAKTRLAKQPLGPERSLQELEKDKRWLKREL